MRTRTNNQQPRGVLRSLRAVIPDRDDVTYTEALRIAELQANKLLEQHGIDTWPVPTELITALPRLRLLRTSRLTDGMNFWDKQSGQWVIGVARADSWRRQRFTVAHEFKHVIDHVGKHRLYRDNKKLSANKQREYAADYFAGCLLIPRRLLKSAWGNGIQQTDQLARLFNVSEQAIGVRLRQTGLVDTRLRCIQQLSPMPARRPTTSRRNTFAPLTLEELPA